MKLSLAQKVRLYFIASLAGLSLILAGVADGAFDYYPILNATLARGNFIPLFDWLLVMQIALIVLGVITFVRFLKPRTPATPPAAEPTRETV